MEILKQLGINDTIWIQLVFFFISYFFISTFLIKPYRRNLAFRKQKTSGTVEDANKLMAATEHLAMDYAGKIKNQNEKVMQVFSQLKSEGAAQEQKLVTAARAKADELIAQSNAKITKEIQEAQAQIQKQIPELSRLAAGKLLGRELN